MAGKAGGKKQAITDGVAQLVGAGKAVAVETVDFSDPKRPKTCLEVDFPILPVNQVATIEGNAGKPIYQLSKWWARRRSSVFRSLLLAASMKAPEDPMQAAKAVWDVYYANHQKKGALKHLKVADIFMGGGTTVVEGARLGLQMFGNDLNPVAWFVVKNELATVDPADVQRLLGTIEAEVKPQIIPFYICDCPRGHRGKWTRLADSTVMGEEFDPLALKPEERSAYRYDGPEVIYVFWAKHGPCQVRDCGHRTPIVSTPLISVKAITLKAWRDQPCTSCGKTFDMEEGDGRMAPGAPFVVADDEPPFAVIRKGKADCPHCGRPNACPATGRAANKKIELSLLLHPQWLSGSGARAADGTSYGGRPNDDVDATLRWTRARAQSVRFVEVRGKLPEEVTCPETGITFSTSRGTVARKAHFACGSCGAVQDVLDSVKKSGKMGPVAAYAIQGYCPTCDNERMPYGGRFFSPLTNTRSLEAVLKEWSARSNGDLSDFWPRSELPYGLEADFWSVRGHGYTHWWTMFNPRQLLVHSLLLKAIAKASESTSHVKEYVLSAFQQYLRNQCMFTLWNPQRDTLEPHFSKNNFRPKSIAVENCVFAGLGRGNWNSCSESLFETIQWRDNPWEIAIPNKSSGSLSKSEKLYTNDPVNSKAATVACGSSTDLSTIESNSFDLVITDPPFGDLLQYAELSDFFYVWMRLALRETYPALFDSESTPRRLEAVANRAREPEDPDGFYQRVLTQCWSEAFRILKPGGTLAFTFHHSDDEPWLAVLESLFAAGFFLEATYPIRSDETKGDGQFGAQLIEYDIIHVCRKRLEEPTSVSWGKLRRAVVEDVQQLKGLLQHHANAGLPLADLQVIRRGKALEYYSRHYGKVYIDAGRTMSVREALLGINQLLDEDLGRVQDPPPVTADPITRQLLRIFDGRVSQPRDQLQKYMKGTGMTPDEFKNRGWCVEEKKTYHLVSPPDVAREWCGRHRKGLTSDYDQAMFLIGACFDGSGINATETLNNENLRPHPAIKDVIEWHVRRGAAPEIKDAATRALALYKVWEHSKTDRDEQTTLF